MILSSIFCHAVTFSHVLHLDVVTSENLNFRYNAHTTTVLCDTCMYIHYNAGAGYKKVSLMATMDL